MKKTKLNVLVVAMALMLTTISTALVVSGDDFPPMDAPTITDIYPSDGATNVDYQLNPFTFEENKVVCNVTVEDADGDLMDVTFATNESGVWVNKQTNSSVGNGTYRWHFTDCDTAGTQYWWRVYVNDSTTNVSATYSFTTAGPIDMYIQNTVDSQDFIDVKKGEHLNLTVYTDVNEMWIDTVEPWEITFTAALLEGVDSDGNSSNGNVTWGDLLADTIFEKTGTWHNDVGILNGTVNADGDTNTSGDLMFFHFDTGEGTGTAYVNMTVGEVGVAFTDNDDPNIPRATVDRPFTVSNLTMFIHYYIPTEPSAFTATTYSQTQINLTWTKDTTGDYGVDPDDGVGEYVYIERNTVDSWSRGDGTEVYNGTGTSFEDDTIEQNTEYFYQAWSYNVTDGLFSTSYSETNDTTESLTPPGDVVVTPYDGVMMNLSWTVVDADSDKTYIERNTAPGPWSIGDGTEVYNDTGSSFTDTDLDHNTTYYYQLWVWDEEEGIYSATFSTGSNTTTVLLAPTSFSSSWNDPNQHTQIDLTWTKADGTDTTFIERNTVDTWNRTDGTMIYNDSGVSFTDTGLNQNTHYYYKAWSFNATEGFSATYDSTDNTTDDFVAPTSISVTPDDGVKMDLSWTVTDPDSDYVYVERNTVETWVIGAGDEVCNLTVSTTTFKDDNLDHDTTYYYQFWNYNTTENIYSDLYAEGNNTTSVLLPPTSLSVVRNTAKPHTQLDLTWTNADGIDSTYIERNTESLWSRGEGDFVYNGTGTSFTDTGLSQDTFYNYIWWSYNVTEGFSNPTGKSNNTDDFVPPTGVTAVAQGDATIQLDWTIADADSDYTIVERNTIETWAMGAGTEVYNDTGNSYLDDDITLDHSTTYYYQLWAYNVTQVIYSDNYAEVNETTSDLQAPESLTVIWNSSAEHTVQDISWVNNEADADATVLEYMEGSGSSWNPGEGTELYNDSGLSFVHSGLTQNTLYRYQVWSWNESEGIYSPLFDSASNTTADLLSPSPFTATVIDWDGISLSWTIADIDSDTTYIERNTVSSWSIGGGTEIYNDTGTSFDDTSLDSKTQYFYQAWAYNATENIYSTLYSSDNDTTLNTPPVKPTNVYPTDNKPYCSVYPTYRAYIGAASDQVKTDNLTVYVEDPDGDNLDVEFYWSDGEYIGTVTVASGTNAVLYLDGNISADKSPTASAYQWLKHDTTYSWYAIANDTTVNPSDAHTNTSNSWSFNTSNYADINENGEVDFLDVSLLASNYRDTTDPGEEGWDMNNDGISNYIDVSGLVSSYGNEYHTW